MDILELICSGLIRIEGYYWYPTEDNEEIKAICESHNERIRSMSKPAAEKAKKMK